MSGAGPLAGKTALVTGGSRGLGRALCLEFARQGARVAFTWSRDEEGAGETLALLRAGGETRALAGRVPVLEPEATTLFLRKIEDELGPLDILVNNAGVSQNLPLALLEEKDWDLVLDTNLKGAYLTARCALRRMIGRKAGVVLNIGSLAGTRMIEAPLHYCASKAGLKGLTEALAKEVARYGIRVLCLAPGLLAEGLGSQLPDYRLADYLKHCALGRLGTLEEAARFAAFLVSPANGYMSGETVVLDGGL